MHRTSGHRAELATSIPPRTAELFGDLAGGLAAAAVLLPQAMAFGVALYALAGLGAAEGAYAGLAGAALLCIASGLCGGTRGLISAPTGPTLVLLGGAVTSFITAGLGGTQILLAVALTVALAGVLQAVIGLAGGGRLIKYIPFPVVSGFMTGSAILMILSQRGPLFDSDPGPEWGNFLALPALTAVITIITARVARRYFAKLPGPVAGLVVGTLVFHLLALWHGGELPQIWMIGDIPSLRTPAFLSAPELFLQLPLGLILPAAATLAVLASLDTLLTAVIADVASGARHDSRRELLGQGIGQICSGLGGGTAGAGTTGATVIAIRSGGRRWVAVIAGMVFVLLVGFGGELGRLLPIGALAGVILHVALGLADTDIVKWAKHERTRLDAAVAVLVTLITVFYDLMFAVALGVAIAATLFIREHIRAPVVHRRSSASQMRSIRKRPAAERALLDQHGARIILYELRGSLFFGTADRLIDELAADLDQPNWIILHMRKVMQIDLTALRLLRQMAERLSQHGGSLLLCELHRGAGIGEDVAMAIRDAGASAASSAVATFNGSDEALEFAEDALLDDLGHARTRISDSVTLADNGIATYLDAADLAQLEGVFVARTVANGARLFAAGDEGDDLFLVSRGEIEIRIATTAHHYKRLASYGPGTFFGELALLREGARAADAVAIIHSEVLVLSRAAFESLKTNHPAIAIALLSAICDVLVTNQRWSTQEMQRLSEW